MTWISVKDRLPELEQTVMVQMPAGNGSPLYAWGARLEYDEGWMWGVQSLGGSIRPGSAGNNDIEADDDYPVTHWQPLPVPAQSA